MVQLMAISDESKMFVKIGHWLEFLIF